MASRILDMGDMLTLIEQAEKAFDQEQSQAAAAKLMAGKGEFGLDDFLGLMRQMRRMGPMSKIMGMLPGVGQMKGQIENIDERKIVRHIGEKTNLLGFEMEDGEELFFHGCFVDEGLEPNTRFLAGWDIGTDGDGLVKVDEDGQVVDAAGEPVPGLYAAGDLVAGERNLIAASFGMGQNAGLCASDSLRKWHYPT
jgi:hypothetical protein